MLQIFYPMTKKATTLQVQIHQPCDEKWDDMHPLPGGRFCDACEKTVVDFTQMTDNEVVRFLQKNNQSLCGQFKEEQLNIDLAIPRTPSSFQKWKSAAAIAAGLLSWNAVAAQTNSVGEGMEWVENMNQKVTDKKQNPKQLVKGKVKDARGESLIGANILLDNHRGTTTNVEGEFELEVPADWESFELTFSYVGFETQVIELGKKEIVAGKVLEVKMEEAATELKDLLVIGYKSTRRKSIISGMVSMVSSEEIVERKKETETEEEEENPIASIYPNPFVDFVNVMLQLEKEDTYLFHLYDTNGQLLWAKTFDLAKGKQELRLDFSEVRMASGHHFLRMTNGGREMQTKKIIKVSTAGEIAEP